MAAKQPLTCCAYTGELLSIEKIDGAPLWCVKGGFNPSEWISGVHYDELKRNLMRREGGKTARKMRCPYKGTEVRILENDKGMIRAEGAFSPAACVWESRREAEWEISWRNGEEPEFAKEIRITVGEELRQNSNPAEGILGVADNLVEQMNKTVWVGIWSDVDSMIKDFEMNPDELIGVEILLAFYSYEFYSGEAFVLFRKDGKLYEVNGSHCSCFGLEDQWSPEETSRESILLRIDGGKFGMDGCLNIFRDELIALKDEL